MSRMIFGLALGLGLAAGAGCGSKPAPTQPDSSLQESGPKKEPESVSAPKGDSPAPPSPSAPKAEPGKLVWELDPAKHVIPDAPVRGRIAGVDVVPEVMVTGEEVVFRAPAGAGQAAERSVILRLASRAPGQPAPQPIPGRNWKIEPTATGPEVWLEVKGQPILAHSTQYGLTLELGPRKNGKVNGKVYMALPDKDQTVLAGTFSAEYFRLSDEKPGADDAPFVAGAVTVTGAAQGAQVRLACAAFLPDGSTIFFPESQSEVKGEPVRFEHTRLDPGRYLISAAVAGGPAVWKWVDVPANGMLTESLALDATKTGGLEVTAPADAKGTVLLAPADDAARPPLVGEQLKALSVLTVRANTDVVAGKALVKNLGPGRYEVRLGDERRVVDVTAGKTTEVNLTPPKK